MKEIPLFASFCLATSALWLQKDLLPDCALSLYAPFLAHLFLRVDSKLKTLWIVALAILPLDLLSSHPFGLYATSATLTASCLHRFRSYFFHDRALHFALYTFAISLTFSSLEALFLFLFDTRLQDAGKWLLSSLWRMPWIDALYALIWFWLPLTII